MISDTDNLYIINQLKAIGWDVKNTDSGLGIIPRYSKIPLLRLRKNNLNLKLSQDEVYAYSVLFTIEDYNYEYYDILANGKAYKSLKDDLINYTFNLSLSDCINKAKEHISNMYYETNWSTLKPILEKLLKTSRKDSIIYKEIFESLCKKFDELNV